MGRPAIPGFILLFSIAGCGSDSRDSFSEVQVRDSAGIRIVEVSAEAIAALPVWTIGPEPIVSIGEVDGEEPYLFTLIGDEGVAVLPDSNYAIFDTGGAASYEIRVFDRAGRFLRKMGRRGDGPGEFAGGGVWIRASSDGGIVALDQVSRRLTAFDSMGTLESTTPGASECDGTPCSIRGLLSEGHLLLGYRERSGTAEAPVGTVFDGNVAHYGLWSNGRYQELATIPDAPRKVTRGTNSRGEEIVSLTTPLLARSWDVFGFAGADQVAVARPDRYEISFFSSVGVLEGILRVNQPPTPITAADRARLLDAREGTTFEDQEVAATRPFFGAARFHEGDHLWVTDFSHPLFTEENAPVRHTVFDADGMPIARVEVRGDPIWQDQAVARQVLSSGDAYRVITTDELGVRRFVVFPILRD